jgi:hypothetical protein
MLFCTTFKVSNITLGCSIQFELTFISVRYKGSTFSLLCVLDKIFQPLIEDIVFFNLCFCLLCQKSDCYNLVVLFLGLLFCFIGFASVFMIVPCFFKLLWLCSIIQNPGLWYLQCYSFCLGLLLLLMVLYVSLCVLYLWIMTLGIL